MLQKHAHTHNMSVSAECSEARYNGVARHRSTVEEGSAEIRRHGIPLKASAEAASTNPAFTTAGVRPQMHIHKHICTQMCPP
jgi:hypothetical protein